MHIPDPETPVKHRQKVQRHILIIKRVVKWLAGLFFAAQTVVFVSFIYEEALQAQGFAVRSAIDARDAAVAHDCMNSFLQTTKNAQRFQDRWGWLAFWANDAFKSYFGVAAPCQLAGYVSQGVYLGLWTRDINRWSVQQVLGPNGWSPMFIDKWKTQPVDQLKLMGFNVELFDDVQLDRMIDRYTRG